MVEPTIESLRDLFAAMRPSLSVRRRRHFEEEARIFAEVLREGQGAGAFAFKDASATAGTLLLARNSLLPYSLGGRELGERSEVAKTARLADLILSGLIARDVTPGGAAPRLKSRRR